jgi:hypothetical protein
MNARWKLDEPMWEILVPASTENNEFSYEHHKQFDDFVKQKASGLTIMKSAKGEWISPDGRLFKDKMIPCRICCSHTNIREIMRFALEHYRQESILAYMISNHVKMLHRFDNRQK